MHKRLDKFYKDLYEQHPLLYKQLYKNIGLDINDEAKEVAYLFKDGSFEYFYCDRLHNIIDETLSRHMPGYSVYIDSYDVIDSIDGVVNYNN